MNYKRIICMAILLCLLFTQISCKKSEPKVTGTSDPIPSGSTTLSSSVATVTPSPTPSSQIVEVTDFSFLANKTRLFPDADPSVDSWYPGKTVRNLETGEATRIWERDTQTLRIIDQYKAIYRGDENQKICYLTFDCGYEYINEQYPNGVTNSILDTLLTKGVHGTFFVTGAYINESTPVVKRMIDEGHVVGNHTMNHKHATRITYSDFVADLMENHELFSATFPDAPEMTFYRPPEGAANEWTLALAEKMGLTTVFWSATQIDYDVENQPDPDMALQKNKEMLHNGCVYLLHAISTTNAQILGELINYIQSQGYEIRTLNDFVYDDVQSSDAYQHE